MDTLRAAYQDLAQKPGFQQLRQQIPVLATWDDHDYGMGDTGGWYSKKEASERVFADFFNVPEDSPRRRHPGIYGAKVFGPPGKRVQVILLDTRYFRSRFGRNDLSEEKHERGFGPYGPSTDPEATMLGKAQWDWLAEQLEVTAEIRLIVSSIQVISSEHGWEVWAQLPREREHLFRLVEETQANGVIFLSGDVHWAEVSRYDKGPYPLYDVTSSALNQKWPKAFNLPNPYRVSSNVYPYPNFGMIEIDWSLPDPLIQFRIVNEEGDTVIRHQVRLSELQF